MLTYLCALIVAAPAKVAPMTLAEMVRWSDIVVIGSVVRVEEISPTADVHADESVVRAMPAVAEVRVERWIKGAEQSEPLVYYASSTWICDITSATVGERALFFFSRPSPVPAEELSEEYRAAFGTRPVMWVVQSGRGRMPLSSIDGVDHATCWVGDVLMPKGAPLVPGPEPEYSFIKSIPVSWLEAEVARLAEEQRKPWLRAEVVSSDLPGTAWRLDVRYDRRAELTIGTGSQRVERELTLGGRDMWTIEVALRKQSAFAELPSPTFDGRDHRVLTIWSEGGESVFNIGALPDGLVNNARRDFVTVWSELVRSIDDPACIDHRARDAATEPTGR